MIQAIYPAVFALIGAVGYIVSKNPEVKELSRLLWLAGMIALALSLAGRSLAL